MTAKQHVGRLVDSKVVATLLAVLGIGLALVGRFFEAKTHLYADLQHFFAFAEVAFTPAHFDYYASVADQNFTYAHLPLFPLLLAPFHRLALLAGWDPVLAVKALVHTFEVATVVAIIGYANRRSVQAIPATLLGLAWLLAPWQFEAAALNGHVTSVAAFFLVLAFLRLDVPWQAGVLMALATMTRTEFAIAGFALAGWYARRGVRDVFAYGAGALGVGALIVGPYLVRDAGAWHWGVIGHLQGRGDALPVVRGFLQPLIGELPARFHGPQDSAMFVVVAAALVLGWASHDRALGVARAALLYALALTLGHGRYYVFPLTAGILAAATPVRWPWVPAIFVVEFFVPIPRDVRWILRALAIAALFVWPGSHRLRRRRNRE